MRIDGVSRETGPHLFVYKEVSQTSKFAYFQRIFQYKFAYFRIFHGNKFAYFQYHSYLCTA